MYIAHRVGGYQYLDVGRQRRRQHRTLRYRVLIEHPIRGLRGTAAYRTEVTAAQQHRGSILMTLTSRDKDGRQRPLRMSDDARHPLGDSRTSMAVPAYATQWHG